MPDRVGQQIGNYQLVKLLGSGGFADVYLGQHVHLTSKQAAIKVLHLANVFANDAKTFMQEAETTEKLVHPYIVRLLDFALEQGTPFLVMDYAPGGSLRTRHPKGSQLLPGIVIAYLNQIADALQYAHDQHILHRDIKPDNILIGRQGELLLSDFGIAVFSMTGRTSLQQYGVGGTPFYMAPEQYVGKPEKASDQYALAIVVYEWICGKVPFNEGNFIQLGYQHSQKPVPPLWDTIPSIPSPVEAVMMRALAKNPKDRFGSVREFAQAFQQAASGLPEAKTILAKPAAIDNKAAAEALVMKGRELFSQKRYEEALAAYDQAITLYPKYYSAYHWKGYALYNLGRYEKALAAYDQAISLDPKSASAYDWKGHALQKLGRNEEALAAYDQAISLDPKNASAYDWKGYALQKLGRYEEALAAYNQWIRLNPKVALVYRLKGDMLQKLGRNEEALAAYDQAISLNPEDERVYRGKGEVLQKLSRNEEAESAFELAEKYQCSTISAAEAGW